MDDVLLHADIPMEWFDEGDGSVPCRAEIEGTRCKEAVVALQRVCHFDLDQHAQPIVGDHGDIWSSLVGMEVTTGLPPPQRYATRSHDRHRFFRMTGFVDDVDLRLQHLRHDSTW